tara:strand:- start:207 stop:386 length:180 start_codon:yes stop_codon:yes gene_type:complete
MNEAQFTSDMIIAVLSAFLITGGFAVWLTILNAKRCNAQKEKDHAFAIVRNDIYDETGY